MKQAIIYVQYDFEENLANIYTNFSNRSMVDAVSLKIERFATGRVTKFTLRASSRPHSGADASPFGVWIENIQKTVCEKETLGFRRSDV